MSDQQDLGPPPEQTPAPMPVNHPDFAPAQPAQPEPAAEQAPEGPRYSALDGRVTGDDPQEVIRQLESIAINARKVIGQQGNGYVPTPEDYASLGIEYQEPQYEPEPLIPLLPGAGQVESVQDIEMIAMSDPRGAYELAASLRDRIPNADGVLQALENHWIASDPASYMQALKQEVVNQIAQSNEANVETRFDTAVEKAVLYARTQDPSFAEYEPQIIDAIQHNPWLMDGLPMDQNGVYADTPALAERLVQVQRWVWAQGQAQAEAEPQPKATPPRTITRSTTDRGDDELSEHVQRVKDSVVSKNTWAFN